MMFESKHDAGYRKLYGVTDTRRAVNHDQIGEMFRIH